MFTPQHVSRVTCNMSPVMCHLWRVTCHMSPVTCIYLFIYLKKIQLSVGASLWRVCYQRGLPHLVLRYKVYFFLVLHHLVPKYSGSQEASLTKDWLVRKHIWSIVVFLYTIQPGKMCHMPLTYTFPLRVNKEYTWEARNPQEYFPGTAASIST